MLQLFVSPDLQHQIISPQAAGQDQLRLKVGNEGFIEPYATSLPTCAIMDEKQGSRSTYEYLTLSSIKFAVISYLHSVCFSPPTIGFNVITLEASLPSPVYLDLCAAFSCL